MPGMFGVVGMTLEIRNRCRELFVAPWDDCVVDRVQDTTIGAHSHAGTSLIRHQTGITAVDGDVSIYSRLSDSGASCWTGDSSGIEVASDCRGNVAFWNEAARCLAIATEWTGSFPLYFCHRRGQGFLFSSRASVIAPVLHPNVDRLGIVGFLRDGHFTAGRTIWDAVTRLQPGQSLFYDQVHDTVTVNERSRLWATTAQNNHLSDQVTDKTWSSLGNALPVDRDVSLMMSGGWDSRTLLARHAASAPLERLMAYSHGDVASREIGLAQRLAGESGIAFHQEPIDRRCYELAALRLGFDREEHVVFPHWHRAGRLAATMGSRVVTAGVYGEVLGGHYGRVMLLAGGAKAKEVLRALLRPRRRSTQASADQLAALSRFLHATRVDRPWVVSDEWWRAAPVEPDALNADVDRDLFRLKNRGIQTIDQLVEAYVSEHRGTQYANAQIRSSRSHADISLPFVDRALLEWVCALPLGIKIHNRLNQRLLRRFAPSLLRHPLAATLATARRPLLIQEASRFVRKGLETGRWRARFASGGRVTSARLSWVNFEFLRQGNELRSIVDDLHADLWDKPAMFATLERAAAGEAISMHSLSDHLLKVYTIDLGLRAF